MILCFGGVSLMTVVSAGMRDDIRLVFLSHLPQTPDLFCAGYNTGHEGIKVSPLPFFFFFHPH
jgi:hypothetical protein